MDDLGWADLSCYGSKFYETPNLDRLRCELVKFTNGYAACPVCSPTRASIMTGKYPARVGITNYLPGKHPLPYSKLLPPEQKQFLGAGRNNDPRSAETAWIRFGAYRQMASRTDSRILAGEARLR